MRSTNNAVLWTPLEIRLTSSQEYANPYIEAELDAVFTHESGKEIKVPAFWLKDDIWAVRFTPDLLGKWSYKTECSDKSNGSLNVSGSFEVSKNDSELPLRKHGFITDRHNNRYFTYDDGTPFFWLGDTHWQAPNYETVDDCNYPGCSCKNQFKHEVDNRIEKGFTVYQTYFDTAENDGGGQAGLLPSLWEKRYVKPSCDQFENKIDKMISYLDEVGMCAAIGFGVHAYTVQVVSEEDMKRFIRYIVARYACYPVIWITAQEITRLKPAKDETKTVFDTYLDLAKYLSTIDGYHRPLSAHMDVMDVTDERAQRLSQSPWHSYWMTQGGHGITMTPKKSHYKDYSEAKEYFKPVIEGELSYEDLNCGQFCGNKTARVAGWNAILNGCAGYTYGASGIWANGYSTEKSTGWLGECKSYSHVPWYMGLDLPGSFDMKYMKEFILRIPAWHTLVPAFYDTSLGDFLEDELKLMARNENTVICYFRNEDTKTGKILKLDENTTYTAMWFEVYSGNYIEIGSVSGVKEYDIPDKPTNEDWVFILTSEELKNITKVALYKNSETVTGEALTPQSVSAIGGMIYKDGKLIDQTPVLYDNSPETVWLPFANHATQTFIYDLGKECDVTGIKIVPNKGTLLPAYRVEVSLDKNKWFVKADTLGDGKKSHEGEATSGFNAKCRFVKILLHNTFYISEEEAQSASYKVVQNDIYVSRGAKPWYYPKTELVQISVFGNNDYVDVEIGKSLISTANSLNSQTITKGN